MDTHVIDPAWVAKNGGAVACGQRAPRAVTDILQEAVTGRLADSFSAASFHKANEAIEEADGDFDEGDACESVPVALLLFLRRVLAERGSESARAKAIRAHFDVLCKHVAAAIPYAITDSMGDLPPSDNETSMEFYRGAVEEAADRGDVSGQELVQLGLDNLTLEEADRILDDNGYIPKDSG
jgi:hypothetical protein